MFEKRKQKEIDLKEKKNFNNNNLCIDHTNMKKRKNSNTKKIQTQKKFTQKKFTQKEFTQKKKGPHTHIDKGGLGGSLRIPSHLPLASFASWAQIIPGYNVAKASSDESFLPPLNLHANSILPLLLTSNIGVP